VRLSRPVLLIGAAVTALGVAVPMSASAASAPAPATTLYFHSANGSYAADVVASPNTPGTAPQGATLSAAGPQYPEGSYASATTYGLGLRGTATLPLFSIPVTGSVSTACFDVWASPDGSGNVLGTATLAFSLVRPGLTAVALPPLEAPIDDAFVAHIVGQVDVPAGTELPAGSTLQVAGAYSDDPTEFYYDSPDKASRVTFNCAAVAPSESPSPAPTSTGSPAPAPAPGPGAVSFTNYTPPPSMGQSAGEPSLGVNPKTNAAIMQAGFDTMRVTFDEASPANATWALSEGQTTAQLVSLDPIGYVDRVTGRAFDSQLVGACSLTEYSDDDGRTWTPSQGCGLPAGADHQTLGGGPFGAGVTGATYSRAVYYCSQSAATAFCALSRDGGVTFGEGTPIYTIADCGGLHGHVRVAPDGTAYVPNKSCGGKVGIAVQQDANNLTPWVLRTIPDSSHKAPGSDPSVDVDKAGRMYVGYRDGNGQPRVATSPDRGITWTPSTRISDLVPGGIRNMQFSEVVAGDAGRAAFAFVGTPTAGDDQNISTFTGAWHMYVAMTYDSGQTWTVADATPTDPVQRGSICTGGTTCGADRNLLDFNDITLDNKGRVLVGYADGCTGACVSNPAQNNRAALATIARQSSGKTLLAAFDGEFAPAPDVVTTTTYTGATSARSGTPLTVSAAVTPADAAGQVRYTLAGQTVTAPVGSSATLPAAPGTLTVSYLGSKGFAPSGTSAAVTTYDVRLQPSPSSATPVSGATTPVTVTAYRTDTNAVDSTWTGTATLTASDTHASGLSCAAAVAGVASCGSVVLGDLGGQLPTAASDGGYLSGTAPVTVQPTELRFVNPPTTAKRGAATTYTTAPVAGVSGALLDGYSSVQALSTNGKADSVPAPQSCSGSTCTLTVTFGKGGGSRTITVQDTSTPSRSASTSTKIQG
jgi:hypothetical protein